MSWFYKNLIRRALFTQNAEKIHNRTMHALGLASRWQWSCDLAASVYGSPELPVEVLGLKFPNPVGLAAGLDKAAEAVPIWPALGFGFSELGAVTWHAQPGNPQPRVFRAIKTEGIVNRMGFNNAGAEAVAQTLDQWRKLGRWPNHPVGINLGKSKITPLENAPEDYANSFRVLRPHADFFVVNVSSPNTPNLRKLQDKSALDGILAALQEVQNASQNPQSGIRNLQSTPILVKVAPDLSFEALDEILELVKPRSIAGIIATNTTISRPETSDPTIKQVYSETGGLSGRPLRDRSTEVIRHIYRQTRGSVPIVGVGGIFDAADAWEKITAGSTLLQVYTSMIYEGPGVAKAIVIGLKKQMQQAGFSRLEQAVGIAVK